MNVYSQNPKYSDTVELNGAQTYYEIYGNGSPLFLLHGFTQSSKSWLPFVPDYSNEYEVYLIDLMGHGKSSPFTENISVKSAAAQLEALVEHLGLDSINVIGYSYGGEVLFQLALLNPDRIRSMVIVGSCGTWNAEDFPEFVEYLSYKNVKNLTWMHDQQVSEERIKNILDQMPNYSVTVSDEELRSIKTRTLLVVGDNDPATPLECVTKTKTNLPNAFLWVVPNSEHRVHQGDKKDLFVNTTKDFLRSDNW